MKAIVRRFSAAGDTTLLEYETETADMVEVNKAIEGFEKASGGRAFDYKTGEMLNGSVTREQTDVLILDPICGG